MKLCSIRAANIQANLHTQLRLLHAVWRDALGVLMTPRCTSVQFCVCAVALWLHPKYADPGLSLCLELNAKRALNPS